MIIDFKLLPSHARIWIYQADRKLTGHEKKDILERSRNFVEEWTAHGKNLKAGTTILHDRFLILSVDESSRGTSGCSIDSSVRFIRSLEDRYKLNLLDRSEVAYMSDNTIQTVGLPSLKKEIDALNITRDTLIFNNLVENKGELETRWLSRAEDTWVNKHFK